MADYKQRIANNILERKVLVSAVLIEDQNGVEDTTAKQLAKSVYSTWAMHQF